MLVHVLLFAIASSVFRVMYPYYLSAEGLNLALIGGATSIGGAVAVLALPFTGLISDTFGRKPVIFTASFMIFLAGADALLGVDMKKAIAGQLFFMIAFNIGAPARNALIADSVSFSEVGRVFGLIATFFSLARVLSPYPAGLIAERLGYHMLFTLDSILALSAGLIALFFLKETVKTARRPSREEAIKILKETVLPSRGEGRLLTFLVMDRFSWALWIPLLSPYLRIAYSLTPSQVGLLFTIIDLVGLMTQYLMGRASDKYGGYSSMVLSEIVGIIVIASLSFHPPEKTLWAIMGALGFSFSSWIPGYNSFLSRIMRDKNSRGRFFAKTNFYRGASFPPASATGGYLFNRVGLSAPFHLSLLLLSVTTVYLIFSLRGMEFRQ